MIMSKVRRLRFEKQEQEGRKLTYTVMQQETGLAAATLASLLKNDPIERINGQTLDTLCRYFACGVGDVLEFVPDKEGQSNVGQ